MPAQRAVTPHALAETVASGAQWVIGPARDGASSLPWILGGVGALIAGGIAFFVLHGGHRDAPPSPAPAPATIVQPAAAPPAPVAATPQPAVAPVDAAPAPVEPATVVTPDAAVVTPAKKPKHGGTATPTGTHDSHSIEDPFH